MDKKIGCVILAAGESKRMGTQKLLLPTRDNVSMIRAITLTAIQSSSIRVFVIVNPDFPEVFYTLKDLDVEIVNNESARDGMSTSFLRGIAALQMYGMDGGVFLLGDMPSVQTEWIDRVVENYLSSQAKIVQACYHGVPSHPVLFDSSLFPYSAEATGDEGGRRLIRRFSSLRVLVEMDSPCPIDLDTKEEYEAYRMQK